MQYDVFISYSRKDIAAAETLCRALDEAGVKFWIDRNMHGSVNFLSEITRYIRNAKAVLFIASDNSAKSEWTQKEILYALKHKKTIIPYRLGKFHFEENEELDFVFTNVQWIDSLEAVVDTLQKLGLTHQKRVVPPTPPTPPKPTEPRRHKWLWALALLPLLLIGLWFGFRDNFSGQEEVVEEVLVEEVSVLEEAIAVTDSIVIEETPAQNVVIAEARPTVSEKKKETPLASIEEDAAKTEISEEGRLSQMVEEGKGRYGVYQVGDYYDDGEKQGVVFEVDESGRHGKIVGLNEVELQWCTGDEYDRNVLTGATDTNNGRNNQVCIQQIADWRSKYPVFAWCADQGEGWYLPARNELLMIYQMLEKVNRTLAKKSRDKIQNSWYWSSSEYDWSSSEYEEFCVWFVHMYDGDTARSRKKYSVYVRAVSAF